MARRFTTHPVALAHLLADIDAGRLALPDFQRSFVWAPGQTAELIVSLARGYPAGSLMLWPDNAEIRLRPIEGAPVLDAGEPPMLLLDGQQRLTSLYSALHGTGAHRFFLKLGSLVDGRPFEIDAILARSLGQVARERLDDELVQVERGLFPLARLREGMDGWRGWRRTALRVEEARSDAAAIDRLEEQLEAIETAWIEPLTRYEFPVVQLTPEADLEAVCTIFEKVNSTGEPLTLFELLTARFAIKGVHLRERWTDAFASARGLRELEIEPVTLLNVITLLADSPEAGRPSAVFKLSAEEIEAHWDEAVRGVDRAAALLRDEFGVVDGQWLPYAPMVIPLAALAARRPRDVRAEEGEALGRLRRWYWCSVFGGAYEQGAARRAVRDYHELTRWLDDPAGAVPPAAVRAYKGVSSDRLRSATRPQSALYRGVIGLILRRKPRELQDGLPLLPPDLSPKQLQRLHLFPLSAIATGSAAGSGQSRPGDPAGAGGVAPDEPPSVYPVFPFERPPAPYSSWSGTGEPEAPAPWPHATGDEPAPEPGAWPLTAPAATYPSAYAPPSGWIQSISPASEDVAAQPPSAVRANESAARPEQPRVAIDRSLLDCVLNVTLTRRPWPAGRGFPSAYLTLAGPTPNPRMTELLAGHLVPAGPNAAIWRDDFSTFLVERAALITAEIDALTGISRSRT